MLRKLNEKNARRIDNGVINEGINGFISGCNSMKFFINSVPNVSVVCCSSLISSGLTTSTFNSPHGQLFASGKA